MGLDFLGVDRVSDHPLGGGEGRWQIGDYRIEHHGAVGRRNGQTV